MTGYGFAAVQEGEILMATISDTERAAMVNWLVTEASMMIYAQNTDEDIAKFFYQKRDELYGPDGVRIARVTVSLAH